MVLGKKYRINKNFFGLLSLHFNSVIKRQKNNGPDKFYTKPFISEFCVSSFVSNVVIQKQDLIVEPSAGNGSFIEPLKKLSCNKIFIDIAPENKAVIQSDFLT
jgi:hypothetical protein